MEFSLLGLIIQIIGCILSSLKSVTSSKFLVGYHPLDLAFRMSFYAVIQMLLLAYVLGEIADIRGFYTFPLLNTFFLIINYDQCID